MQIEGIHVSTVEAIAGFGRIGMTVVPTEDVERQAEKIATLEDELCDKENVLADAWAEIGSLEEELDHARD